MKTTLTSTHARVWIVLALGLAALAGPGTAARASTNAPAPRRWTRADGVKLSGVFVARHGAVLAFKETGGRNVFWNWAQVSARDRAYLVRECAVVAPPAAVPRPAEETRQQAVADRTAKIASRAQRLQTEPYGAATVPSSQSERP